MLRALRSFVQSTLFATVCSALLSSAFAAESAAPAQSLYGTWKSDPSHDANYFPIAVWLQDPKNAERYKTAGINLYVGLWRGPTDTQLTALEKAGMPVICAQNERGLQNKANPLIVGWMHDDEPDNAQSLGQGQGYGPPVLPEIIVRNYDKMRTTDPSRPVLLNLGQGAAWDNYIGRGVRRNHPEDYPEYLKGCDISSFDIYPAVHSDKPVAGKLEYVARGVERLVQWNGHAKPTWNCIECTRISNTEVKPTPHQVRAEVWMSIIHGSRGLIYFVHQFKPTFREAALLDDPDMLAVVTAINGQIHTLAPILNRPTISDGMTMESSSKEVPIACLMKRHEGVTYLFAVCMRNQSARASFKVRGLLGTTNAEVLEESRSIPVRNGEFADEFKPYEVHLYRVSPAK
ncbi:MAG: hypothetical protein EXS30_02390 [Pedosphaera sp.]|nr:hypothetical protein [Pedosphaera sp.]